MTTLILDTLAFFEFMYYLFKILKVGWCAAWFWERVV